MPNRRRLHRLLLVLIAVVLLAATTPVQQADPARYINDVKALSAPEMEGRGAGTKGLTLAQHLIEKRYKELGLQPAGLNGYTQPFTVVTGARLKSDNHFVVQAGSNNDASRDDLKIDEDFVPFSFPTPARSRRRWCLRDTALRRTNSTTTTTRVSTSKTK